METKFNRLGFVTQGIKQLSGSDFLKIEPELIILLDVRLEYELFRLFDVPNIIYMPYDKFDEGLKSLPNEYILVADAVGLRSREVVNKLIKKGFDKIANPPGGFVDWERDGLPVSTDKSKILTGSCLCQLKIKQKKS